MLKILSQEKAARRCEFPTVHGVIQTPAFMNVATCGAIKGAVSAYDLKELHCQVQLCNTYHLHVRPGDGLVKDLGGLHAFTGWQGPILTDSGGFQVFPLQSCVKLRKRASPSPAISTATEFLWGRRRACASSQILAPPLRWHLMSAWKIRRNTTMRSNPVPERCVGLPGARLRCSGSIHCRIRSIASNCFWDQSGLHL